MDWLVYIIMRFFSHFSLVPFYSSGIMKLHQVRTHRSITETNISSDNLNPVALSQIFQILLIMPIGIVCASVLLIGEIVFKYFALSKKKNYRFCLKNYSYMSFPRNDTRLFQKHFVSLAKENKIQIAV